MLLYGIYTLIMVFVACTRVSATDSVNLSADAKTIPGGYVVPERGNVTFTCSSSSGGLLWTVDLKVPGGKKTYSASAGLTELPQVSSPDTQLFANPTSFTIHDVTSENNMSSVECSSASSGTSNATIIVEGSPNCPAVNTTVNTASLAVSIQKLLMMWLPEWYYVEVSAYFNGSIAEVYNSTLKGTASFNVTSLQPGTVYNISVIPCNMAGCNESCDVYSVQPDKEGSLSCPTVNTTVNAASLTVSIQKSPMMWLPEWYFVEVSSYFNGSIAEVYNSTLKGTGSFNVTSLQPGTVYNISVIPCNMGGCNGACDIHSVQTGFDTGMGEPASGVIPNGDSLPLLIIGVTVAILTLL